MLIILYLQWFIAQTSGVQRFSRCNSYLELFLVAQLLLEWYALAQYPATPLLFSDATYSFAGNHTFSAITAVVAANIVLVSYIAVSVLEDQGDQARLDASKEAFESKKNR